MGDVRIVQLRRICRVLCECGLDKYMSMAPDTCPSCGRSWERPRIEECPRSQGLNRGRNIESATN